jgi:hypothetical protein
MNSSKDMGELVKHVFSLLAPFFLSPIVLWRTKSVSRLLYEFVAFNDCAYIVTSLTCFNMLDNLET